MKSQQNGRQATEEERKRQLLQLFDDYLSVGLTSIGDRDASEEEIQRYRELHRDQKLKLRVSLSQHVETIGNLESCREQYSQSSPGPAGEGRCLAEDSRDQDLSRRRHA